MEKRVDDKIPVICGPTASGKTALAVKMANCFMLQGISPEIISADSRQVYRGMDIGTGKDLGEYGQGAERIPTWCLDIVAPDEIFTLAGFQGRCYDAIDAIRAKGNLPLICGGTGLYIEAILKKYELSDVPEDADFRHRLMQIPKESLAKQLSETAPYLIATTDLSSKKRIIRALEIAKAQQNKTIQPTTASSSTSKSSIAVTSPSHASTSESSITDSPIADSTESGFSTPLAYTPPEMSPIILVTRWPRNELLDRINIRLEQRFEENMVEEVQKLIHDGITLERLELFGMEYGHIGRYLFGKTSFEEIKTQLMHAIHRLSKRQMTWFRGMERRGLKVHWIDRADETIAWEILEQEMR